MGHLHFVPYGSLGSVRNNSRDWVIDKFEIPPAASNHAAEQELEREKPDA
jgi:hypothetical protein